AFDHNPELVNLMLDTFFKQAIETAQAAWRRVIMQSVKLGIPMPAMASALAYYDGYR
ncbi:MAG TPA: phosphogluconate dehydrogenase (NADP(+)-dependent, decarboxylating), partial [Oceanospirillaceae bacterium]|nr:phosphogluconate dehydrogenase (NADP(+)-dependent, decarboxylating) [Oceanospirillaceae bacterium]